ncbi:RNA-splicing ligase RtcB [Halioglobus sp. HI00S01]|uniref:RtcB family protein n=1 Tax=Halioglobus sp. HI00S01 TaxID=1822214 RepID=UPI0007C34816|nr:RtcB family protein [Halioglobus sp. HI00S01]KZX58073.1 RNA-splicing ligase RtcB [Halioglobus sp. HI00S01]
MNKQNYTYEKRQDSVVGVKSWTGGVPVEPQANNQLHNLAKMPFVFKHVAAMPDVHFGRGATVGSVFATKGAVIPAAVGVDIGCGMMAAKTTIRADQLPDSLRDIRLRLEAAIPVGQASYDRPVVRKTAHDKYVTGLERVTARHGDLAKRIARHGKLAHQIGTLGGGNHFIEVCLDENQDVWVMLHSGSRGTGNIVGNYFIELAKREMERHFIRLPDQDLAYLVEGSEYRDDYIEAMTLMQDYAAVNRETMFARVVQVLTEELTGFGVTETAINCHHNYATMENHFGENVWVTRKGAVRAREGDLGIIPGSMGTGSFIVRGLGNAESFCSCSHGAGRVMSRGEAKRRISVEQHKADTAGIECRKDRGVLDESPAAYKNIEDVMAAQSDLVEVVYHLNQVLNIKG